MNTLPRLMGLLPSPRASTKPCFAGGRSAWVAVLLAFLMVGHIFDPCDSHVAGLADAASISVPVRATLVVPLSTGCDATEHQACERCSQHAPHRDACETTSEIVTLSWSNDFHLAPPVRIATPSDVLAPDIIDLMPVACAFLSRVGPDVPVLASTLCRNPLQGRAPPVPA